MMMFAISSHYMSVTDAITIAAVYSVLHSAASRRNYSRETHRRVCAVLWLLSLSQQVSLEVTEFCYYYY